MHLGRILWTTGCLLSAGCRGLDDGDLMESPDGSHCPKAASDGCDEACVDTSTDPLHCGACGAACKAPLNATGVVCDSGACAVDTCKPGLADCDRTYDNGCETVLATSRLHCGACGHACASQCVDGACDDAIEVSAGPAYTCAIRASGSVWCWGDNSWGNLGIGPVASTSVPQKVDLPKAALAITTGKVDARTHTCALLEGGAVACWGANGNGQLGTGDNLSSASPLPVDLPETIRIAAGGTHTCAVSKAHQLRCWGANGSGQLGIGMGSGDKSAPVVVINNVADVALGAQHTCLQREDGPVACWGANTSGQVGNGAMTTVYLPVFIPSLAGATSLALGTAHSCALFGDGSVKCWGAGAKGQLGSGGSADVAVPQLVTLDPAQALIVGFDSSAAVVSGKVWGWGDNAAKQIDTGDTSAMLVPAKTGRGPVERLTIGGRHACAIRPSGQLVCWGDNAAGQLGTGNDTPSAVPVEVVFPSEVP
jgi:alpha-tubulin suppressor-like RCC1 family protein